jgi:glycosyltransferase involved in cell wall biosynthesis
MQNGARDDTRYKLAIVATHPIQYQAPLWRRLAQNPLFDVKVFYADAHGTAESFDPLYGKTFSWDVPLLEGYDYEFLKSVRIPGLPGPTACYYPLRLGQKIAAGEFEAVLILGYMSGAAWAGYRAARRLGLPIFIRGDSHLVGRNLTGARARIKMAILSHFLRRITCCLAIGEWNRQYWRHYGVPDEKIRKTFFSVDNARFQETLARGKTEIGGLRNAWGVSSEATVFAFSGNLQPHKGVDVLIRAFLQLLAQRIDVHLLIIGKGPVETELKAVAGGTDRIHWVGFVNQSKMPLYLAAADVFVLPSYMDAWGLVVNEAMACGLPCIVSNAVGAGPDLVSGPDTGLVFPAGDVDRLYASLERATDPAVRAHWISNIPGVLAAASYDDNVSVIAGCVRGACALKDSEA